MDSPEHTLNTVRKQIEDLSPESVFWTKDLAGNPSTARAAVARLSADPDSGIRRLAPGLYWRGVDEAGRQNRCVPFGEDVALVYAGRGGGFVGWSAIYSLQWGHQGVRRIKIAVAGRQLRSPVPSVDYLVRKNSRRRDLTWTEVSVLEALAAAEMIEYDWSECMRILGKGWSGNAVGGETVEGVFRPAAVVWAAETDDLVSPDLVVRADEIMRAFPDVVHPANPAIPLQSLAG